MECAKCAKAFEPQKGLKNYCSLACRNSRPRSEESRSRSSKAAKQSNRVQAYQDRKRGSKTRCRVYFEVCKTCNQPFTTKYWGRRVCSELCRVKYIMTSRRQNAYKRNQYNGVRFDSSWEAVVAKFLDDNKVKWERGISLNYEDAEGKTRRYFPDFYLPDYDLYVEPKNKLLVERDRHKLKFFESKIKLLYGDLNHILEQLDWIIYPSPDTR